MFYLNKFATIMMRIITCGLDQIYYAVIRLSEL